MPDFLRLWLVGAFANAMRWLELLASGLFAYEVTHSALAVTGVVAARQLPQLCLGAFAGAISEAVNRKVIVMLALVAVAAWTMRRTLFGRHILAVGGNDRAARLAGVPVDRVKRGVYAISGLCAGIAGLVVIAINSSSDANLVGLGMELDAIAAVAVGGTAFTGGQANVVGSLVGALLIQLLRYTLLANGVPDAAALIVKGAIIAGAVWSQQRGRSA